MTQSPTLIQALASPLKDAVKVNGSVHSTAGYQNEA